MKRKLGLLFCLVLGIVGLFFWKNETIKAEEERIIGIGEVGGWGTKRLLSFASTEEVKVKLVGRNVSGNVAVTIYKAELDDVLNFLVHDNEYFQKNGQLETDGRQIVGNLETTVETDFILPVKEKNGVWLVEVKKDNLTDQSIVTKTDFGTIVKSKNNKILLWNQSFETKLRAGQGRASVYDLENGIKKMDEVDVDENGLAELKLTDKSDLAVVEMEGKMSIVPLNATYLNSGWVWKSFEAYGDQSRYFIFTDRPIYKPGDTVFFKAIVRDDQDAIYSIPSGQVKVEIYRGYGGDNKVSILEKQFSLNKEGSIEGEAQIPEDTKMGHYTIAMSRTGHTISHQGWNNGQTATGWFNVQAYRKPDYTVSAETNKQELIRGDNLELDIGVEYFSGQPVSAGKVDYKIHASGSYYYDDWWWPGENDKSYYRTWGENLIKEGSSELDEKGKLKLDLASDENDSEGKTQTFSVEVAYKDSSGNISYAGKNFLIKAGEFSILRDNDREGTYSTKPRQEINLPIKLRQNKQKVNLEQNLEIRVLRKWHEEVTEANQKYPTWKERKEDITNLKINTNKTGEAMIKLVPEKEGRYIFQIEGKDERDNTIRKEYSVWVDEDAGRSSNWTRANGPTLKIKSDREEYEPGDEAKLKIESEVTGDVLLMVERSYVHRYQVVALSNGKAEVRIKIEETDIPNIYATVKQLADDSVLGDATRLSISAREKEIVVGIKPDKEVYGPGEEITLNLTTEDAGGNPLPAEVAVWAIDKSIFELSDRNFGNIFSGFWEERYRATAESDSLRGIGGQSAEAGGCFVKGSKVLMADGTEKVIEKVVKGEQVLTRLSQTSDKLVKAKVVGIHREKEAGYFLINGRLKVTGNHLLSVNRKWARVDRAQKGDYLINNEGKEVKIEIIEWVGLGTEVFNLEIEKYHTYFVEGIWVHNDKGGVSREHFADTAYWNPEVKTDSSGRGKVVFKLPDNLTSWVITAIGSNQKTMVGEGTAEIKVKKNVVIRPVLPNILRKGDKLMLTTLVHNFTDEERVFTVGIKTGPSIKIDSKKEMTVKVKKQDFEEIGWWIEPISETKEVALEFWAEDKNDKEFGDRVNQKIEIQAQGYWKQDSEFRTGSAKFKLNVPKNTDKEKSTVSFSIVQTMMGSLPKAMEYLTGYPYGCTEQTSSRLVALLIAKENQNLFIEATKDKNLDRRIKKGIIRLRDEQKNGGGWAWWSGEPDDFVTAYTTEILSWAQDLGYEVEKETLVGAEEYLKRDFNNKSQEEKAIRTWGLSFFSEDENKERQTEVNFETLPDDVLALTVMKNLKMGIDEESENGIKVLVNRAQKSGHSIYWEAGSITRFGSRSASTAIAVRALIKSGKYEEKVGQGLRYLTENRKKRYWNNTFGTSQAIWAVVEETKSGIEKNNGEFNYEVLVDGKQIATGSQESQIEIPLEKIKQSGEVEVRVEGKAYLTLESKLWVNEDKGIAVSNGVKIKRKYVNERGEEYALAPGELVNVELEVEFDDTIRKENNHNQYGFIEDILPAGMVVVNMSLKNERYEKTQDYYRHYDFFGYGNEQVREDGVLIPIQTLENKTYRYLARVISAGEYQVPPAVAGLMYQPEVWGRSEFGRVKINQQPEMLWQKSAEKIIKDKELWWGSIVTIVVATGCLGYLLKKKAHEREKTKKMDQNNVGDNGASGIDFTAKPEADQPKKDKKE